MDIKIPRVNPEWVNAPYAIGYKHVNLDNVAFNKECANIVLVIYKRCKDEYGEEDYSMLPKDVKPFPWHFMRLTTEGTWVNPEIN